MKKILAVCFALLFFLLPSCYNSEIGTYDDGYDDGYDEGRNAGYEEGYADGYECSEDENYSDWYEEGYADGYFNGFEAGAGFDIRFEYPDSSLFSRVGYDPETEVVGVRFVESGKYYFYYDVPPEVYEEFINADSLGSYYQENIKGIYPCQREDGSWTTDTQEAGD